VAVRTPGWGFAALRSVPVPFAAINMGLAILDLPFRRFVLLAVPGLVAHSVLATALGAVLFDAP
jgi:uncharacterized membrane protein YdjX (TVP38/TMEM64 family)